jgi:hypothetical protein
MPISKVEMEEVRCRADFPVVVLAKDRPFFGPRMSHFVKVEPKISISEDKGTELCILTRKSCSPIPSFQLLPPLPKAVSQMYEEENKHEMER